MAQSLLVFSRFWRHVSLEPFAAGKTMTRLIAALVLALSLGGTSAYAQSGPEVSFYTGIQEAPHSRVRGTDPGGVGDFNFLSTWEGRSGDMPPYYGFRATWWRTDRFGWGVEFNHAKVYADDATLAANGFSRLEFTDGLNLLTANAMYRWPNAQNRFTPYVGFGAGVAIPHVDVETAGGTTFEYQLTGPAVIWIAGASYAVNDRWSVFGEYKGSYSMNEADLDSGGTLETDIVTNALNLGVSFQF